MRKITCAVVDDDADAIEYLTTFITRIPRLKLVWTETSSKRALKRLNEKQVDLLFVDISMPYLDGFSLVHALYPKPHVIMVTAHDSFAVQAFDLDVVDYLIKTVSFERFMKAVNKVIAMMGMAAKEVHVRIERDFLYLKDAEQEGNTQFVKVDFSDIHYIEITNNTSNIILSGKRKLKTRKTLYELEEALPEHSFLRLHRSYIIALDKISSVAMGKSVRLNEIGVTIPIGEHYRGVFNRVWKELRGEG